MNRFGAAILTLGVISLAYPLKADKYDRQEFRVILGSSFVVPAPPVTSSGVAWVRVHTRRNNAGQLTEAAIWTTAAVVTTESNPVWSPVLLIEGAAGQTRGATLQQFAPLARPALVVAGTGPANSTGLAGQDPVPVTDLAALERLLANPQDFHLLVATQATANGTARGQLRAVRQVFVGTSLKPSSVVPAPSLTAAGESAIHFKDYGDYVVADLSNTAQFPAGTPTRLVGLQLHEAAEGVNGPNLLDLRFIATIEYGVTDAQGGNALNYPLHFTTPAALEAVRRVMARPEAFYLQMTSGPNPGGALRGQLRRAEVVEFQTDLKTENVAPAPQGVTANGVARFRAFIVRNPAGEIESASFGRDGWLRFTPSQLRLGLTIYEGVAGASGPAVLMPGPITGSPSAISGTPLYAVDNYGVHTLPGLPGSDSVRSLQSILANPAGHYAAVHSTAFPTGFLRGQLAEAAANLPAVSDRGVINAAGVTATAAAAPRGLTSVFGSNLATSTGIVPLTPAGELAEQFNGTGVTVGGMPAKLLFASPGQLNIQVPDVPPGRHPLRVTTAVGSSAVREIDVAATAPGIFVITKADYSLITENSPVAAGEPIILWTTGLGTSNPRVAAGVRAPADPLSVPAIPEVLFGSTPGEVAAAALAPGFAGVEQVVALAPGTAGQVEVKLRAGGATSNAVAIHIR